MIKTYLESAQGTRYIVSWNPGVFCREVLERIVKYYCRSSKQYEVTFVLGHGSRFMTISVDCLLLNRDTASSILGMLKELNTRNVTGVRADSREEALELEQEIMKGYEWAILKA